jgi:hypothetical protein
MSTAREFTSDQIVAGVENAIELAQQIAATLPSGDGS